MAVGLFAKENVGIVLAAAAKSTMRRVSPVMITLSIYFLADIQSCSVIVTNPAGRLWPQLSGGKVFTLQLRASGFVRR